MRTGLHSCEHAGYTVTLASKGTANTHEVQSFFPPCKKCLMQRKTVEASMAAEHAERSWVAFNIWFDDVP